MFGQGSKYVFNRLLQRLAFAQSLVVRHDSAFAVKPHKRADSEYRSEKRRRRLHSAAATKKRQHRREKQVVERAAGCVKPADRFVHRLTRVPHVGGVIDYHAVTARRTGRVDYFDTAVGVCLARSFCRGYRVINRTGHARSERYVQNVAFFKKFVEKFVIRLLVYLRGRWHFAFVQHGVITRRFARSFAHIVFIFFAVDKVRVVYDPKIAIEAVRIRKIYGRAATEYKFFHR